MRLKYYKNYKKGCFLILSTDCCNDKKLFKWAKWSLDVKIGLISSLLIGIFFLYVIILSITLNSYAVEVDGQVIAVVDDEKSIQYVTNKLVDEKAKKIGKNVEIKNEIVVKNTDADKEEVISEEELYKRLSDIIKYQTDGAVVRVNDVPMFVFDDLSTAEEFIKKLKNQYGVVPNAEIMFEENVHIAEAKVQLDKVTTIAEALAKIQESVSAPKYMVKEGDTLWDIAYANNISVDKLMKLNPEFKPEYMQIGQELKLSDKEPIINVVCMFEETQEEKINAPVQVKRNEKMLQGKSKVIQEGSDGLKRVVYKVINKNGIESERVVLSEEIIEEPVPRIIEKGARVLVASRDFGGGRLAKPSAGVVTSPFGVMRWGRMHTGVDFGAAYGSAVVAAEAGKVIRAGWYGGYGLCVDISHGGGMVTRYAHLSKINVKVGAQVQRRQVIGSVGSTGNSTGPHLHFEVIINGRPQNPMSYL